MIRQCAGELHLDGPLLAVQLLEFTLIKLPYANNVEVTQEEDIR